MEKEGGSQKKKGWEREKEKRGFKEPESHTHQFDGAGEVV